MMHIIGYTAALRACSLGGQLVQEESGSAWRQFSKEMT